MTTDMQTRMAMMDCVQRYLNDRCDTTEVQDAIVKLANETEDETAKDIGWTFWWWFEDDCCHQVILKKESWDAIQRMLLVLAAGGHIQPMKPAITSPVADALAPFCSITDMRTALRRSPGFRKQPFRRELEDRHLHPWPLDVDITPTWFTRLARYLFPPKLRYRVVFPT